VQLFFSEWFAHILPVAISAYFHTKIAASIVFIATTVFQIVVMLSLHQFNFQLFIVISIF
jgi:hypothetical protein